MKHVHVDRSAEFGIVTLGLEGTEAAPSPE
jgi:hypothetical protein